MDYSNINIRYSDLAETSCCLSCGGAVNYAKPQPGNVCVDLGSGRGTDAIRLAEEVGSTGFVFGIDISDGMIAKAQKTAKQLGIANVTFLQSPLEKLPLENSSVDIVISNCTINHASDKQLIWNEVYRILQSGGSFIVSDIYSLQPIPSEYKNDPEAVAECWAGSVTRTEYLQQLSNAGFTDIIIMEESKPYEKGKVEVCSWTISGKKSSDCCSN